MGLGFEEPLSGNLKEERRSVVEWLAWSMEGSHAPRVLSWERLQGASFSYSVKKSEMSGCRERSGPRGDCNPFLFLFFQRSKRRKIGRKEI
jgi:hypothetical protein